VSWSEHFENSDVLPAGSVAVAAMTWRSLGDGEVERSERRVDPNRGDVGEADVEPALAVTADLVRGRANVRCRSCASF
jgi:hypothetical protein